MAEKSLEGAIEIDTTGKAVEFNGNKITIRPKKSLTLPEETKRKWIDYIPLIGLYTFSKRDDVRHKEMIKNYNEYSDEEQKKIFNGKISVRDKVYLTYQAASLFSGVGLSILTIMTLGTPLVTNSINYYSNLLK